MKIRFGKIGVKNIQSENHKSNKMEKKFIWLKNKQHILKINKLYALILNWIINEENSKMSGENIHENCENYNGKKDMCLKWFEEGVSEKYKVCKEYSEFNDKELSRKWSN